MGATNSTGAALRAAPATRAAGASRGAAGIAGLVLAIAFAGCATAPSQPPQAPVEPATSAPPLANPPPPPVNLQGFPLAYRQGFGDGCSTARGTERKDGTRFGNDGNYRVGWQDGVAQCKATAPAR